MPRLSKNFIYKYPGRNCIQKIPPTWMNCYAKWQPNQSLTLVSFQNRPSFFFYLYFTIIISYNKKAFLRLTCTVHSLQFVRLSNRIFFFFIYIYDLCDSCQEFFRHVKNNKWQRPQLVRESLFNFSLFHNESILKATHIIGSVISMRMYK